MKRLLYCTEGKWVLVFVSIISSSLFSCKKYLNEKPTQSLAVPSTLDDLQAVLNNANIEEISPNTVIPTDDYYFTTADWQAILANASYSTVALSYEWDDAVIYPDNYWNTSYTTTIYFSNFVLDFLPGIAGDQATKNTLQGTALFYRAAAFQQLAQLYCRPYSTTAATDPGIVLKLSSNIEEPIVRSTVEKTYDQIIDDLKQALGLLPTTQPFPTRPNKAAAYGELARTYLCMSDYVNAGLYADSCLQQDNSLMDYNTLVPVGNPHVPNFNAEVIFHQAENNGVLDYTTYNYAKIDSLLYQSYAADDLRKLVFFQQNTGANAGTYAFLGSYYGILEPGGIFCGITTDEMYLTRAECYARAGNVTAAMADLNTLLVTRWQTGTYTAMTATDATDALNTILTERRKELVWRGQRWSDLRRLNLGGANITLTRIINGVTYTLPPNDDRWVMLLPLTAIDMSHLAQNPR